jgi:GNAT superfamily N-acetyltransferase
MLTIDYLINHEDKVELVANWLYEEWKDYNLQSSLERSIQKLKLNLNKHIIPTAFIAFENGEPVGLATIRKSDGIREDLFPWLGSLYVTKEHRGKRIAQALIERVKEESADFGYSKLYLLAFRKNITNWYNRLGWELLATESFRGYEVAIMESEL